MRWMSDSLPCFYCPSLVEGDGIFTPARHVWTHLEAVVLKKSPINFFFNELPSQQTCSPHRRYWRDSRHGARPDWQLMQTWPPLVRLHSLTARKQPSRLQLCLYLCVILYTTVYAFQISQHIKFQYFFIFITYAFLPLLLLKVIQALSAYNLWLYILISIVSGV